MKNSKNTPEFSKHTFPCFIQELFTNNNSNFT